MIWTIEIAGRAVMAFSAEDSESAQLISSEPYIREDLELFEDESGKPLWDGDSDIFVREAEFDEQKIWDKVVARAVQDGDVETRHEALDHGYCVFLIPIRDPTDDAEEFLHGKPGGF